MSEEAARIPSVHLAALAALRGRAGVRVAGDPASGLVWVRWPAGDERVAEALRPVPGAEFFEATEGRWRRKGSRLPAGLDPPEPEEMASLAGAMGPAAIAAEAPRAGWGRSPLRIVPDDLARPATAVLTTAGELLDWAGSAPSAEIERFRAAGSGGRVLLIGRNPPWVGGVRFWGARLLVPLGWRFEPDLPEEMMAGAIGLGEGEIAMVEGVGEEGMRFEIVPGVALRVLSRYGMRRSAGVGGEEGV